MVIITKRTLVLPSRFKRNSQVTPFIDKYINLTSRTKNYAKEELRKYDAYIVGSDQIWRYSYSKPVIKDVYLSFTKGLNCKRISYAASFGVSELDYPSDIEQACRVLLQQFNAVSVREETAIKICKEHFQVCAKQVVDPTLLNDKQVYEDVCKNIPTKSGILVAYVLDMTPEKKRYILETSKEKGLEAVILTEKRKGGITIEEWLAYFRDASFVFTDSFHGTVFSIIFEKDFITFDNSKRGSDRFVSLLHQFSLEDRLVDIDNMRVLNAINWKDVRVKKEIAARNGNNFLQDSLNK
jgi:hypothetical protein